MNLNSMIQTTLAPLNVPVAYMVYTGTATTYVTYQEYNLVPTFHAEDSEKAVRRSIQIDVWSTGNFNAVVDRVEELMLAAGFTRNTIYDAGYDSTFKTYHKIMRFYLTQTGGN